MVQVHLGPLIKRGCSSAGRAPALQAGGRRFKPDQLHFLRLAQNKTFSRPRKSEQIFCSLKIYSYNHSICRESRVEAGRYEIID